MNNIYQTIILFLTLLTANKTVHYLSSIISDIHIIGITLMVSKPLTAIIAYKMHRHVTENLRCIYNLDIDYTSSFSNVTWRKWISDVLIIPGCQGNAIDSPRTNICVCILHTDIRLPAQNYRGVHYILIILSNRLMMFKSRTFKIKNIDLIPYIILQFEILKKKKKHYCLNYVFIYAFNFIN